MSERIIGNVKTGGGKKCSEAERRNLSKHMAVHYVLAAGAFGVVFFLTKSLYWSALAFLINIFLDADHLFDYWLANGFNLNAKEFVRQTVSSDHYCKKSGKVFVPFHSWELVLLLLVTAWIVKLPHLDIALTFGFLPHLFWDQTTYAQRPLMYFFLFRAFHKSDLKKICG